MHAKLLLANFIEVIFPFHKSCDKAVFLYYNVYTLQVVLKKVISSPLVSRHSTSAADLQAASCAPTIQFFHCSGFLFPIRYTVIIIHTGITSVFTYSGSTNDACHCDSAQFSKTCDNVQLHQPPICSLRPTSSVLNLYWTDEQIQIKP